ncbi:MAG: AMP-dependent synthetase/ligase [Chitinophagales bacterium]
MNFTRTFDVLPYQAHKYEQQIALAHKIETRWQTYSTHDCIKTIDELSKAFLAYGIQHNDKIAIIASINSPEWNFVDLAIQQIGAINVPIHATTNNEELKFILNYAEVKMCFVSSALLYRKVVKLQTQLTHLKAIYSFVKIAEATHWKALLPLGKQITDKSLNHIKTSILENDIATIIFTSGTTGTPKGVMLSHRNIVSNIKATLAVLPIGREDRMMSFLPLSHIFERTVTYIYMAAGASVYYSGISDLEQNLQDIKPHYFTVVPRVLEKMFEKVERHGRQLSGQQKRVFDWAIALGENYELDVKKKLRYSIELKLAKKLVFSHLIRALGGEVRGLVIGAAALQIRLAKIFSAAGIAICEGYGLTETSPILTFNRFNAGGTVLGTVGVPIPSVDIRIAEDGEILVKGPNVMQGYYKRPDLTAEIIDEEEWLHTGDVGEWVKGRFLKITDRKKELFKISTGRYVAPQPIEKKFRESSYIDQIMIVGSGEKHAGALIVPNWKALQKFCKKNGVKVKEMPKAAIAKLPIVQQLFKETITTYNQHFTMTEKVRTYHLIEEAWTQKNGLLTPTFKLKRKAIFEKHQADIEKMYA